MQPAVRTCTKSGRHVSQYSRRKASSFIQDPVLCGEPNLVVHHRTMHSDHQCQWYQPQITNNTVAQQWSHSHYMLQTLNMYLRMAHSVAVPECCTITIYKLCVTICRFHSCLHKCKQSVVTRCVSSKVPMWWSSLLHTGHWWWSWWWHSCRWRV